mmetsp:Transcript_29471/g.69306  ORF Transcript_29471/g.69306 Transcript_29471/m.69306 type:complete len:296 (+) Transcript_29471:403-1290(+)
MVQCRPGFSLGGPILCGPDSDIQGMPSSRAVRTRKAGRQGNTTGLFRSASAAAARGRALCHPGRKRRPHAPKWPGHVLPSDRLRRRFGRAVDRVVFAQGRPPHRWCPPLPQSRGHRAGDCQRRCQGGSPQRNISDHKAVAVLLWIQSGPRKGSHLSGGTQPGLHRHGSHARSRLVHEPGSDARRLQGQRIDHHEGMPPRNLEGPLGTPREGSHPQRRCFQLCHLPPGGTPRARPRNGGSHQQQPDQLESVGPARVGRDGRVLPIPQHCRHRVLQPWWIPGTRQGQNDRGPQESGR